MTRIWIVLASLSVVGCGNKPDCEKYAKHLAELGTAGMPGNERESRRSSVELMAREACNSGEVTASVVGCVNAATTRDESLRCELGETAPAAARPPEKPAGIAVHRTGFSVQMPTGWTDTNKTEKTEALLRGDGVNGVMILRQAGVPRGLASEDACRSVGERFASNTGAVMESSALATSVHLGKDCRILHHDAKMKIEGHAFAVGDHESLVINCFYEPSLTTPPSFCHDVIESVALD